MQSAKKDERSKDSSSNTNTYLPAGCVPELNPQQQEFVFDELTLDSKFDSGNLSYATRQTDNHYNVWISPDCGGTSSETHHRSWFYFRVTKLKPSGSNTYTFTLKNISSQLKLLNEGLLPVYRSFPSSPEWKRIKPQPLVIQSVEKGLEVSFNHTINSSDTETYFAFTYPWSYAEDQTQLNNYENELKNDPEIYFNREVLVYSREQRRVELITISSHTEKTDEREKVLPDLFPEKSNKRPFIFNNKKKYVFISSRVHPGETPASYMFNALLKFIVSKDDPRAKALRDNFVMVLVPMLNPDGVSRGHYRVDTHGLNLNRMYINPNVVEHPSIYAAREIVLELNRSKRLFLYCDLHAHAGKKGCFVYGNKLAFKQQVESKLFAKLLSMNSEYFEYDSCSFSESNTKLKDKNDGEDKEGAGRVALFKQTNLTNCYTLECNYNSGSTRNVLSKPIVVSPEKENNKPIRTPREEEKEIGRGFSPYENFPDKQPMFESYTYHVFEDVGAAIGPALIDMIEVSPLSRVKSSPYKNLKNLRVHVATTVMKEPSFKVSVYTKKSSSDSKTAKPAKRGLSIKKVALEFKGKEKEKEVEKEKEKKSIIRTTKKTKSLITTTRVSITKETNRTRK